MIGNGCIGSCAKTQRYKYFYSIQTQGIKIQRYKKILNHVRKHKENFTNPNSSTMTQKKMKCIDFNYE